MSTADKINMIDLVLHIQIRNLEMLRNRRSLCLAGVHVSLKNVTSDKIGTLGENIKAIVKRATTANGTEAFSGVMKDITGMVTAKKFTIQEIKDKITSVRLLHPENSTIVKKYFVQGNEYWGYAKDGIIKVHYYLRPDGTIISAFPKF